MGLLGDYDLIKEYSSEKNSSDARESADHGYRIEGSEGRVFNYGDSPKAELSPSLGEKYLGKNYAAELEKSVFESKTKEREGSAIALIFAGIFGGLKKIFGLQRVVKPDGTVAYELFQCTGYDLVSMTKAAFPSASITGYYGDPKATGINAAAWSVEAKVGTAVGAVVRLDSQGIEVGAGIGPPTISTSPSADFCFAIKLYEEGKIPVSSTPLRLKEY